MAVDRSITIYLDSGLDREKAMALEKKVSDAAAACGACVKTYTATVTVGTKADILKYQVGSGGTNTVSISVLVDAAVTRAKWWRLIKAVADALDATGATITDTYAAAYTAGSRSDSVTLTVT